MLQNDIMPFDAIKPVIIGCDGAILTQEERSLFSDNKPAGLILFQRNCVSKDQVTDLIAEFRAIVGWNAAPVLIDQEGGTVARLKAPEWREFPPAVHFSRLSVHDMAAAKDAVYWNALLMGMELCEMGITVNCAPVMDVPARECHGFLADSRSYGQTAEQVTVLSEYVCRGLLDAGVIPVMKHIPGHGRGTVDSHKDLPRVSAAAKSLQEVDYMPFRELSASNIGQALWAMGAHIVYEDIDALHVATESTRIVTEVIRDKIGFDGVLIADDIGMEALQGSLAQRARQTLASGLDMTLHCSGILSEMQEILETLPEISQDALMRIGRVEEQRRALQKDNPLNGQTADMVFAQIDNVLQTVIAA